MSEQTEKSVSRRRFMKIAGLSAGAAAGLASAGAQAAGPSKVDAEKGDQAAYRETDHVKRYYELAQL